MMTDPLDLRNEYRNETGEDYIGATYYNGIPIDSHFTGNYVKWLEEQVVSARNADRKEI